MSPRECGLLACVRVQEGALTCLLPAAHGRRWMDRGWKEEGRKRKDRRGEDRRRRKRGGMKNKYEGRRKER